MTRAEISGMVTTQITSAAACRDEDGSRSPSKVARLLAHLRKQGSYQSAFSWLRERDTDLSAAAAIVTEQNSGHPRRCDETWEEVLANLDSFAEQKGSWQMASAAEASRLLGEVVGSMRADKRIATKTHNKREY